MLTMGQLKFVTFNCVSLIDRKRKQWVLNELLKLNADIVFLQETKLASSSQVQEMVCFLERHFSLFHSNAIAHSGGAAILIRKKSAFSILPEWESDKNGRICAVELLFHRELYKVVCVHAPNSPVDRKSFFISLRQYLDTPANTILAGDFNCVLNAGDCSNGYKTDSSLGELRKLLRDFDLQDVTEMVTALTPGYTHWQENYHIVGIGCTRQVNV